MSNSFLHVGLNRMMAFEINNDVDLKLARFKLEYFRTAGAKVMSKCADSCLLPPVDEDLNADEHECLKHCHTKLSAHYFYNYTSCEQMERQSVLRQRVPAEKRQPLEIPAMTYQEDQDGLIIFSSTTP